MFTDHESFKNHNIMITRLNKIEALNVNRVQSILITYLEMIVVRCCISLDLILIR